MNKTGNIYEISVDMRYTQTKATAKYQEKVGLVSKSYKLKRDMVEEFAAACERQGISQAAQLSKMMQEFIDSTK